MASSKDIKEKVLWIIESKTNEKSGGGTDLRVVQWIIDGKPTKPGLEKRDWFLDPDGNRKIGKAKAFTASDLAKVLTNIKKIARLLEMKPDHLDEALQLAMYQDDRPGAPAGRSPTEREPVTAGTGIPNEQF